MEDSLKRLKQARKGASAAVTTGTNGGPTDDSKIRLQLALDVEYLGEQVGVALIHKWTQSKLKTPSKEAGVVAYVLFLYLLLSQIQKMGLRPSDISMFSTLMELVKEARDLAEQNQ